MKNMGGAVHPSYCLKLKYPLPFSVSYIQLVTQQYKSRTVLKSTSINKIATMKSMDAQRKPSCVSTKLTLFTVSKDEWNTKGGHLVGQ